MEEVNELIERYGLREDVEHIIIPFTGTDGKRKKCYLLKRRFIRLVYPDGRHADFPLPEVIEAIVKHPEERLSETLYNQYNEREMAMPELSGHGGEVL